MASFLCRYSADEKGYDRFHFRSKLSKNAALKYCGQSVSSEMHHVNNLANIYMVTFNNISN